MKNIIIAALLLLTFASCEKPILSNGHSDLIVVQAYLYAGAPVDSVRLSQPVLLNSADTIFHGISNATVSITTGGKTFPLIPSAQAGYYQCPDPNLTIVAGKIYSLNIVYNNVQITSQTGVPDNPAGLTLSTNTITVDTTLSMRTLRDTVYSISVNWSNPTNDYYFIVLENTSTTLVPINVYNPYGNGNFTVNSSLFARRIRSSPTQNSTTRISLFTSVANYGKYQLKLYKVTKDYASLYQSRTQSSTSLQEPFTNVNNGLGIFTAFSACDSIAFSVVKLQ